MLERIASPDAPPLDLSEIMTKRDEVEYAGSDEREGILSSLDEMERVFMRGRGNLEQWTPEVLDAIDKCFKTTFMSGDEPIAELFFPYDNKGIALFNEYCEAVDGVLQAHEGKIPPHAWAYFTYFTIWEKRDYTFPVPLGTASVIDCLHKMASRVRKGMIEVSHTVHCVFLALSAHMDSPVRGTPPSRAHGFSCARDSSILRTWILLCAGLLHPAHVDSPVRGTPPSRAHRFSCARGDSSVRGNPRALGFFCARPSLAHFPFNEHSLSWYTCTKYVVSSSDYRLDWNARLLGPKGHRSLFRRSRSV
jgi:hypothetical protein